MTEKKENKSKAYGGGATLQGLGCWLVTEPDTPKTVTPNNDRPKGPKRQPINEQTLYVKQSPLPHSRQ